MATHGLHQRSQKSGSSLQQSFTTTLNDQILLILPSQESQNAIPSFLFPHRLFHSDHPLFPRWPVPLRWSPISAVTHPICLLRSIPKNPIMFCTQFLVLPWLPRIKCKLLGVAHTALPDPASEYLSPPLTPSIRCPQASPRRAPSPKRICPTLICVVIGPV